MDTSDIRNKFYDLFKNDPIVVSAPGRINLIGEHTDYNDGYVLPAAINKNAQFAIALNSQRIFRFHAIDLDQFYQTSEIKKAPSEFQWANYLLGVLAQFQKEGKEISGVDCMFTSDIPIGAGLSSSAAIECGFAVGLNKIFDTRFSSYQLTIIAQKAEHEYAGVMCGIMDQYASIFGKKEHVFRLDCRSHQHQYFQFEMGDYMIALCDSKVKHDLASSEYNLRQQECEKGVSVLQQFIPSIKALRDVDELTMLKYKEEFDPLTFKRCYYIVKENNRVLNACKALEKNDFIRFGELMCQSHEGLQHQYEVSCKELDFLVDVTRKLDFVLGSRMMGGGFGGCTINLIEKDSIDRFQKIVANRYDEKFGLKPDFYFTSLSDGASVV